MLEFIFEEQEFSTWEYEGGRVLNPETFEVEMALPEQSTYSKEQLDYFFTHLISDAIRHVRKFFLTRLSPPTRSEEVGEFVTVIRRLFREKYYDLGFKDLTDTQMWDAVGVPSSKWEHRWRIQIMATNGLYNMNLLHAKILCGDAMQMAKSEQTVEEEFREINASLDNLLRQTTTLNSLIVHARELNTQSDAVLGNLRFIAEKLVSN